MHVGVDGFDFPAFIVSRPARRQCQKLNQMFFKQFYIPGIVVPCHGFAAVNRHAAALYLLALPVDAGILQGARCEIGNNIRNARLAAKAIKERLFSLRLGGLVRGAVVAVALVTVILAFAPTPPPASIVQSKTLPYVIDTSSVLSAVTPHEVKDAFRETKEKVKKMWLDRVLHKTWS